MASFLAVTHRCSLFPWRAWTQLVLSAPRCQVPVREPPTPRLSPEQLAPAWQRVLPIMPWRGLLELQGWHLEEELRNRGWGESGTPPLCQEGHQWPPAP